MEMGTGKTRPIIETAEYLFKKGEIEALVIMAPNGVQRNWVLNEIPKWCNIKNRAAVWSSAPNKKQAQDIASLTARPYDGLRILAVNYEACIIPKFKLYIKKFLLSFPSMLTLDESTRVKSPQSKRTKFIVGLRKHAPYRRIMSGLVTPNTPFDMYKQFEFLDPAILGFGSYFAFKAHFAEIEDNKYLLEAIQKKNMRRYSYTEMTLPAISHSIRLSTGYLISPTASGIVSIPTPQVQEAERFGLRVKVSGRIPQMVKKHPITGEPIYRNLDELYKLITPHSFRVLKSECLDIPAKVYSRLLVDLTPKQRKVYDAVVNELIAEFDEGELTSQLAIVKMARLHQVSGGFWRLDEERDIKPIDNQFPKIEAIMESIEDVSGKVAIWTHYQHENILIAGALREVYGDRSVVQYYGGTGSNAKRQLAVDQFQDVVRDKKGSIIGEVDSGVRFFVGEPHSGGIGIELTKAETVYYYSNSFSLEDRLQSEDRHHRALTRHVVTYVDVEATNTIDGKIINALLAKRNIANEVMGDGIINWLERGAA